jgi:hypothetical protein
MQILWESLPTSNKCLYNEYKTHHFVSLDIQLKRTQFRSALWPKWKQHIGIKTRRLALNLSASN